MADPLEKSPFYDYGTIRWLERTTGKPLTLHIGTEDKRKMREIFDTIDEDGSGAIDRNEILEMTRGLNLNRDTEANVTKAFERFHNRNGEMGFEEFLCMMAWENNIRETKFHEEVDPFQLRMAFQEVAVALRRKKLIQQVNDASKPSKDRTKSLTNLMSTNLCFEQRSRENSKTNLCFEQRSRENSKVNIGEATQSISQSFSFPTEKEDERNRSAQQKIRCDRMAREQDRKRIGQFSVQSMLHPTFQVEDGGTDLTTQSNDMRNCIFVSYAQLLESQLDAKCHSNNLNKHRMKNMKRAIQQL